MNRVQAMVQLRAEGIVIFVPVLKLRSWRRPLIVVVASARGRKQAQMLEIMTRGAL
jgi:hypothetical protein